MKTRNPFLLLILALLFVALGFVPPVAHAQQGAQINQAAGQPWQLGQAWCFGSATGCPGGVTQLPSGSSAGPFTAKGLSNWRLLFVTSGTVSACTASVDSSTLGINFTTGGILSAATIGSCASAGSYVTTSATTPTNYGQLTVTVTGNGSVTVVLFGYTEAPGGSSSVSVSSLPALPAGTNTIGNVNQSLGTSGFGKVTDGTNTAAVKAASTAVQATDPSLAVGLSPNSPLPTGSNTIGGVNIQNVTAIGTASVTNTQCATVAVGGASQIAAVVSGTYTGTLQASVSIDGTNYTNALLYPTFPSGTAISSITGGAVGQWELLPFGAQNAKVCGNTVATGTAVVTLVATPGSGFSLDNIGLWAGSLLGAPSNYGTSPGAVLVPGVNAFVTNVLTLLSHMTGTTPGTAPSDTDIVGCIFNSLRPAPSNGQTLPFQCDSTGNAFAALAPTSAAGTGLSVFSNAAVTTSVNVKASAGNIYGYQVVNGSASVCYLQFINSAGAGTLGTGFTFSVAVPGSGVNGGVFGPFIFPVSQQTQATGIAVGLSTTQNGSTACGSSGIVTVWYK
jgi:hypothetical protein